MLKSYNTQKILFILLFILTIVLQTYGQNSSNLIVNGSFEEGYKAGGFKTLKAGEYLKGWKVVQATVDLTGTYFKAYDGLQSIDLNGTPGIGAMEQTFFTDKGKKYLLSFYMAGNPVGGPPIKKMIVSVGDQSALFEFDIAGKSPKEMGWQYCELVFEAIDRKSTLRFESLANYDVTNYGPVIDLVNVVPTNKKSPGSHQTENSLFGFNYGFLVGASYSFIADNTLDLVEFDPARNDLEASSAGMGIHLGGFASGRVGPVFLRPELRLSSSSVDYTLNGASLQSAKERYFNLDIPLLIGFKYSDFSFVIGPSAHLYFFKTGSLEDLGNFDTGIKRFTYGYETGVAYSYDRFEIGLRFHGNMSAFGDGIIDQDSGKKYYFSDMPDYLLLTLSYTLN